MRKMCAIVPSLFMKKFPEKEAEVVSEAIFGETVHWIEQTGDWTNIQTADGYTGWVSSLALSNSDTPFSPNVRIERNAAHLYRNPWIEQGPALTLPFEARLQQGKKIDERWIQVQMPDGDLWYVQKGDVTREQEILSRKDLKEWSRRFLGIPYTWGGRSSFGYDCSGFVQMLYRQLGISLARDARQQIQDKRLREIDCEELMTGDLLFWGTHQEKVSHVGMYIGEGIFIHTSSRETKPWVRCSRLQDPEWAAKSHSSLPFRTARRMDGI